MIATISIIWQIVKIFARVGIPKEISTDQGSYFTSKVLAEVH